MKPGKLLLGIFLAALVIGIALTFLGRRKASPLPSAPRSPLQTFGSLFYQWRHPGEEIRQEVLSSLEKEFEFCQIAKDDLSSEKKKFWLICNGRPFYALYEEGKVNYELNGWSFLQDQPEVLKELQDNNCRLYQVTDDKNLLFVCEDEKVRQYTFTTPDFRLTKTNEDTFVNGVLGKLLETTYPSCEFLNLDKTTLEGYWAIKMQCLENNPATVYFDPEKLFFTLPVITNENLAEKERVKQSIEILQLKSCNLNLQQEIDKGLTIARLTCDQAGNLSIFYDLGQNMAYFLLEKEKFVDSYPLTAQFSYPFLKDIKVEKLISEKEEPPQSFYYLSNKRVVVLEGWGGQVYLKDESFE